MDFNGLWHVSDNLQDDSIDTRLTGLQQVVPMASWGRLLSRSVR